MKVCYLTNINGKEYTFTAYSFKDKLSNYYNLTNDLILQKASIVGTVENGKIDYNTYQKIKEFKNTINYKLKGEQIIIKSPYTKKCLSSSKKPIVLMIGTNTIQDRLACLVQLQNGTVKSIEYQALISAIQKGNRLANMFLRDNALVVTKGNENMPVIEIGEKLTEEKDIEISAPSREPKKESNERFIIKKMRNEGYSEYVDMFRLASEEPKPFPEDVLVFYYTLFKAGQANIVKQMLTREDFNINQLTEIAEGIKNGIDVRKYADPAVRAEDMSKARKKMENSAWLKTFVARPSKLADLFKQKNKNEKIINKAIDVMNSAKCSLSDRSIKA